MKKALLLFALVAISAVSINAQDNLKWGVVAGMNVSKYTITGFDSRIVFTQVLKQSWDCRRMRMVVVPIWTSLHCLH